MAPESGSARSLLRRLRWTVLRPLAYRPNGDERSRLAGAGVEFAHVREYQPGDDVRRIDWQLTARSDRAYVRESHDERGLDIWLVVDVSPSVDWGTAQGLKRDVAVELSAVAGQLLGHRGNRVGLLMFAEQTLGIVPPMPGLAHLERIVGRLRDEPRRRAIGPTNLSSALSTLPRLTRRPSMVIVISDFLVLDGWADRLRPLARRHEVLAVRLRDPRESELPDIGIVTFEDPETGAQITVDTADARLRQRFHNAAAAQSANIDGTLRACGVELLVVGTDDSLLGAVAGFLDGRRHQRRGGAFSAPISERADEVPVA